VKPAPVRAIDGTWSAAAEAEAAALALEELEIGREYSFEVEIGDGDVDGFAALSGDRSPVHMDDDFARSRGFERRVVHGAYLVGLASRLLGMHLPGRNCLLHQVQLSFVAPTYVGARVRVTGVVDQVSAAVRSAIVKISIANTATGGVLARGKASIGFTEASPR
jgi:3-hydroxybutyryl-CoA dehydratase